MLSYWARDRSAGGIGVEEAVRQMTSGTADLYGLSDRGRLVPGCVGDVNIIDHQALRLHRPEMVYDLPGGARRLVQGADGYLATVKAGQAIMEGAEPTGVLPGRLLRGAR
jgi:N-acyl-D-aspartate/D-glutamate deacylase